MPQNMYNCQLENCRNVVIWHSYEFPQKEEINMADVLEIIRCSNFAAIKHKDQRRKDEEKTPYINHPIGW